MENYFWLVVIPSLGCFFATLGCIGIVACIFGGFSYAYQKMEALYEVEHENAHKKAKIVLKLFIISMAMFFVTCFIPTKKDIIQLKIIHIASELKGIDQIPQKLVDRLNDLLDE